MYNGHADVTLLSNSSGEIVAKYYYDAFGKIIESSGSADNPIRYAGYQYDEETGLYYLNARMYDPTIARFLQEDTYTGDIKDPLSLNLYTYCHNNPLVYYDPTGHFLDTIFDVISIIDSAHEFIKKPSLTNGLALAADVGCAVLPFVSGGGKLVRGASKLVDKYSDFKKAKKAKKAVKAAKAVDKYNDAKKSKKAINILDDIVSTSQKTSRKLNKADKIQDTFNNLNKIDSLNAVDKLKAVDRLKDVEKTLDNTKSLSKLDNFKNLPTKYDPDFAKFQESFTKNFKSKSGGINKGVSKADRLKQNRVNGRNFEIEALGKMKESADDVVEQITIKSKSGTRTRLDAIGIDKETGEILIEEYKASSTAPLTKNQKKAHPEIETSGGIVVGKGKPPFIGGTEIPPTKIKIIRKR